jgi:hypothetical protein
MRNSTNFHPEWGYFAPAPSFIRKARVVLVAAAVGATIGAGAAFSRVSHQAAETSVAARTLVRPIEGASARANTPAHIDLAQANTSPESEEHPAPSLSIVDEARADESKVANRKIYNDTSTGSVPSKFQYFKPFSKEWKQRREEEARRLKAATTICRC